MQSGTQICPHCGKSNPNSDKYCYACGHILPTGMRDIVNPTTQLEEEYEKLEPRRRWGTAYFDEQNRLQLTFRDSGAVLTLKIVDRLTFGRKHDVEGQEQPDIDLIAYEAFEKGVSKLHMALMRDHDTVTVTDLGSANGTFLNGQRLMPHESHILRDNDDLRLGRLAIRVAYV